MVAPFDFLFSSILGSSKFRAVAENISPKTGNVTNKTEELYSSGGSEQSISTPHVGPAGCIRWNIQFLF